MPLFRYPNCIKLQSVPSPAGSMLPLVFDVAYGADDFGMIDLKGKLKRAKKASRAAAKLRSAKAAPRVAEILRAYAHLTNVSLSKEESLKAVKFLTSCGKGVNVPSGRSPIVFLAGATGLTRQHIWKIVSKK